MPVNTMIIDQGLGSYGYSDLMQHSDHFTAVKLAYGTSEIMDKHLLEYKLNNTPRNILLYPGGTLYEYYMKHRSLDKYVEFLTGHGFKAVEVSNGCNTHSASEKMLNIDILKFYEFTVISEIGSKHGETDTNQAVEDIQVDLETGADYITLEGRASGTAGIYDSNGEITGITNTLIKATPRDKLIVEAPLKKQQVKLMKLYGSDIGLGNIKPCDVLSVSCLRKGLRGDTL